MTRRTTCAATRSTCVCLAVPVPVASTTRSSPSATGMPADLGVLVLSKGLLAPDGTPPTAARARAHRASARSPASAGRRTPARRCGAARRDRCLARPHLRGPAGVSASGGRASHCDTSTRSRRRRAGRRGEERRRAGRRRGAARPAPTPPAQPPGGCTRSATRSPTRAAPRRASFTGTAGTGRPRRDGARRAQPQPPRGRAARAGRRARGDPGDPRPGARVSPRGAACSRAR